MKKLIVTIVSLTILLSVSCGLSITALAEECEHPTWHLVNDKPATVTQTGYTGDKVCDDCGEIIETGEELPKLPGTWVTKNNKTYYLNEKGEAVKYWQNIEGNRYYFRGDGSMFTGWLKAQASGKWYYLNTDGTMQKGWLKYRNKWYYLNKDGTMQLYWAKVNGKWYYLNSKGEMITGWLRIKGKWYYLNASGAMATGWRYISGKWYYLDPTNGDMKTGWLKDGETWYYLNASGAMLANTVAGDKKSGYYWVTRNGSLDYSVRTAKTVNGVDWLVLNGKAKMATTESDKTLFRAFKTLEKCTNDSMTDAEKLEAAWKYIKTSYVERSPRVPHYRGLDWPVVYANDIFVRGYGNCMSFASAYAYMAKAIGYDNCYACNSGGHAWAEIEGLIYDPEQSMNHNDYTYYGMSYDANIRVKYKEGIAANEPFMHVEIRE